MHGPGGGRRCWDATGRIGLLHMAFPLKMLLQPDGHLTSCDLLHTVAGAIIFDVYENQDARLVSLQIPEHVLRTFPGPAYGPHGPAASGPVSRPTSRPSARSSSRRPASRPTRSAIWSPRPPQCPLFLFVKEDEDLYPNLDYSPVRERVRKAVAAIERAKEKRRRQGADLRPAHHRRAARNAGDAARRDRSRGHRRDVQRDVCRRHGADGPRGDEAPAASAGDLRPQRGHRREDPRRHLARGDRPVGPAGRHRLPPDGPGSARRAVHSPLRRRNGRRRRRFCRASCRASSRR